jgi:hypothetical protein
MAVIVAIGFMAAALILIEVAGLALSRFRGAWDLP